MTAYKFDQKCTECDEILPFLAHAEPKENGGMAFTLHWDENPVALDHYRQAHGTTL
jgi:hypothetical protein